MRVCGLFSQVWESSGQAARLLHPGEAPPRVWQDAVEGRGKRSSTPACIRENWFWGKATTCISLQQVQAPLFLQLPLKDKKHINSAQVVCCHTKKKFHCCHFDVTICTSCLYVYLCFALFCAYPGTEHLPESEPPPARHRHSPDGHRHHRHGPGSLLQVSPEANQTQGVY